MGSSRGSRSSEHHHDRSDRSTGGTDEARLTGPKESLDDVELEDGKRDIIHREIDKFRETMKIREAEKEAEKQKREKESTKENSRPRRDRSERDGSRRNDRGGSRRSRSKS